MEYKKYFIFSELITVLLHVAFLSLIGLTIWISKSPWWIFVMLLRPTPSITVNLIEKKEEE